LTRASGSDHQERKSISDFALPVTNVADKVEKRRYYAAQTTQGTTTRGCEHGKQEQEL
jgi:hypothetical protein